MILFWWQIWRWYIVILCSLLLKKLLISLVITINSIENFSNNIIIILGWMSIKFTKDINNFFKSKEHKQVSKMLVKWFWMLLKKSKIDLLLMINSCISYLLLIKRLTITSCWLVLKQLILSQLILSRTSRTIL